MIRLELLEKADLEKILQWNEGKSEDFLLQWAGPLYNAPLTMKQLEDYYFNEIKKPESKLVVYKIVEDDTDEIIGTVELRELDSERRIGRVGRFLLGNESSRGKGFGTLALKEIVRIGFEEFGYEKITLAVFDFNQGAIKCYEKSGFKKEKYMENARKSLNGFWSLYEMGISKEDWIGTK